jgi:hypothetical protein
MPLARFREVGMLVDVKSALACEGLPEDLVCWSR